MILGREKIDVAVEYLKNDGVVVFPTETVYGIGANALHENAVNKIFKVKNRAADNPLIVHISNMDMLNHVAKNISDIERKLINAFFPGPFTIVLDKNDNVPYNVTSGLDTVGVRMPNNKVANLLISKCGFPLAAPSANISGKPSGTNIEDIKEELENRVDCMVDSGICDVGIESTVVRVIDEVVHILRPGYVTLQDIAKVHKNVVYDKHIYTKVEKDDVVLSPGMKHKHYAPITDSVLVEYVEKSDMAQRVKECISSNGDKKVVVLACRENIDKYTEQNVVEVIDIGSNTDYKEISKNIFSALRHADKLHADVIIIEGVKRDGIGIAINNRVIRAVGYNVV